MNVYHGSTTAKALSVMSGDYRRIYPGLYVTDTPERAARYANSQASGVVTRESHPLRPHAVVVTIETDEPVSWRRRPEEHPSLDQCEDTITRGRVVAVDIAECDYPHCTCHQNAARIRAALGIFVH